MQPGMFDWPDQYAGDTAKPLVFTLKENGTPISLTGATIAMQVRKPCGGAVVLDLTSSPAAGITIINAAAGEFSIGGYTNPDLQAALIYDIQVTLADDTVTTFVRGTYSIYGQVTK